MRKHNKKPTMNDEENDESEYVVLGVGDNIKFDDDEGFTVFGIISKILFDGYLEIIYWDEAEVEVFSQVLRTPHEVQLQRIRSQRRFFSSMKMEPRIKLPIISDIFVSEDSPYETSTIPDIIAIVEIDNPLYAAMFN